MEISRSVGGRTWRLRAHDAALATALSQRLGLAEVTGRVLAGRGLGLDDAAGFLEPRLKDWLPDPSHLHDLDRAAARIAAAVGAGETVGLIGDYDVDGATSTALVGRYLRALGIEAVIEIPDRLADGYGPNETVLDRLAAAGCALVLTLDSGTTAFAPLAHAAARGQEVIVVDHHAADAELPAAYAVVNPNRRDQDSPLRHVAAVGVAFVLLVAVSRRLRADGWFKDRVEPQLLGWLDLVALGTVCDVVPLTGINRAFVHQGMKLVRAGGNAGVAALARAAKLAQVGSARDLGFVLGPRINAGGRTGRSSLGSRLLMADDEGEADGLAAALDTLNTERRALERKVQLAAETALQPEVERGRPLLIAAGEGWHIGVVGIVAARLVERWHRPTFVLGIEGGIATGSARSIGGFDVGAAVLAARAAGLLLKGGGHAMAAGVTLRIDALGRFRDFLTERMTGALGVGPPEPAPLDLDGALAVGAVGADLATELERLAPYGAGNPEPRFCIGDARPVDVRPVGDGHLSCRLACTSGAQAKAIAFRARGTPLEPALHAGQPLRVAGRIKPDVWQGRVGACFQIEDAAEPDG